MRRPPRSSVTPTGCFAGWREWIRKISIQLWTGAPFTATTRSPLRAPACHATLVSATAPSWFGKSGYDTPVTPTITSTT